MLETPEAAAYNLRMAGTKRLLQDAETLAEEQPHPDCEELIYWLRHAVAAPPPGSANLTPDYRTDQYPPDYRVNCLGHAHPQAERLARQFQSFAPETGLAAKYQALAGAIAASQQAWAAAAEELALPSEMTARMSYAPEAESAGPPDRNSLEARAEPGAPAAAPPAGDPADPPPETCQVLLEAKDLLPAVKAGFPAALQEGIRFHGAVSLTQYIALTGDAALSRLKSRLAFTADHEDIGQFPMPVEVLTTHCNGWESLQTQLFRYMINRQGFPPEGRCPDDDPTLRRIAKDLDELSYRALAFLADTAEQYSWQPFQLLNIHLQTALEQADPPMTLADFLRPEGVRDYQEHPSHKTRLPGEPPPQTLPFRNAEGETLFLTKEHLSPENSAIMPRLWERLRRLENPEQALPEPRPPLRPSGWLNPTLAAGLLFLYRQFYYAFQSDTANDAPELEEAAELAQQAGLKAADLELPPAAPSG